LNRVLFESLTAPSIPSRLLQLGTKDVKSAPNLHHSSSQIDVTDVIGQAEGLLGSLAEITGCEDWGEVEMSVEDHDFYVRPRSSASLCTS
jgi:hypothetical protein